MRPSIRAIRAARWSASTAADRHQHRDLLADRRLGRHRLRHAVQHRGPHRLYRRGAADRAALARHRHAARYRRPRRGPRPAAAGRPRRQGCLCQAARARRRASSATTSSWRCAISRSTTRRACASVSPRSPSTTIVPVKVIRGGKEVMVDVPLAAPPEDPPRDRSLLDGRQPLSRRDGRQHVARGGRRDGPRRMPQRRHRSSRCKPGAYAGRFLRPGDMVVRGQRPGRQERRRSQEAYRRAACRASASAARAWSRPSSSAEGR